MIKRVATFLAVGCLSILIANPGFAEEQYNAGQVTESPEIKIIIDGKAGDYPTVPITVNDRTLLPLRAIFTNLGIPNDNDHIQWNDSEQSVTVKNDKKSVNLKVNSNNATVDGKAVTLDVPAVMYNDSIYVPARFVSQSLGKKVAWDESTKSVIICSEADFNNIKSVLNKAITETAGIKKFKNDRKIKVSIKYDIYDVTNETSAIYQVDKENDKALGEMDTQTYANSEVKTGNSSKLWYENGALFAKNKDSDWIELDATDDVVEDLFDPHWLLKQSDILYSALLKSEDPDSGDIVLSGEIGMEYIYKKLLESSKVQAFQTDEANSRIIIDKTSNHIKYIESNFKGTADIAGMKSDFSVEVKCTNSDINGTFEITRPEGVVIDTSSAQRYYDSGKSLIGTTGKEKEALEYFEKAIKADDKYIDAYKGKAVALYFLKEYAESNNVLDKAISIASSDSELLVLKGRNLLALGDKDKAIELCNKAIAMDSKNDFAYYIKALVLTKDSKYGEALEAVNKAIELDSTYEAAYIAKLSLLYQMKNYDECITFGDKIESTFSNNQEIPWYMADAYLAQYKYEEAIKEYEKVLNINPKNDEAMAYMGLQYYYLQNYDKALECAQKALDINSSSNYALQLKAVCEDAKLPEAQRIVNHVKENYLYFNEISDFDKKAAEFTAKQDITVKDIEQFIYSISKKDDIFTYVLSGSYYDKLQEQYNTSQISSRQYADNAYYLRINSFTSSVAVDFKKAVDSIKDTENKTLIIDLRDNGGGMAAPSNEILDIMLPECVTSYTIDRNGYMSSYYSDASQVKFKNVVILVNENSASSAELLTLGLKKYLNNVTIVGHPTLGKGVGQKVFENKDKKYMVFLVNFYWNVREQNIAGGKITPDVLVQGSSDDDYFKEVTKLLGK